MEKFRGKYRIESNRLHGWDYAHNGMYFITLVTQHRECSLGHIENGKMVLSDIGKIVNSEWLKSFDLRNELFLDEYVIMPNHLHAIIIIDNNNEFTDDDVQTNDFQRTFLQTHGFVETHGRASLQFNTSEQFRPSVQNRASQNGRSSIQTAIASPDADHKNVPNSSIATRKPKSVSSFVGGFKSAVNTKIDDYIDENQLNIPKYNRNNHFFQPNYHDRMIRNHDELLRIKHYIVNNPQKWENDQLNIKKQTI
jgi:REP element-mobilizing transposase RayT